MKNNKNIKLIKTFVFICCSIIFCVLIYKDYLEYLSFKKNTKYSIAKVISNYHGRHTFGGAGYDYIFYINHKTFNATDGTNGDFIKGNKYLVAYDSISVHKKKLLKINITDSIFTFPKNGWRLDEIPFKVDTAYTRKETEKIWW